LNRISYQILLLLVLRIPCAVATRHSLGLSISVINIINKHVVFSGGILIDADLVVFEAPTAPLEEATSLFRTLLFV